MLRLAPDDPDLNRRLGAMLVDGEWLSREELLRRMGMVRAGDGWGSDTMAETVRTQARRLSSMDLKADRLRVENSRLRREVSQVMSQEALVERQTRESLERSSARILDLQEDVRKARSERKPVFTFIPRYIPCGGSYTASLPPRLDEGKVTPYRPASRVIRP